MADNHRACAQSVRLSYEDHEWLARLAQDENLSVRAMVKRAVRHFRYWQEQGQEALEKTLAEFESERTVFEDERQLRRQYQRKYESKTRRVHELLRDMRDLRARYESQLRDERDLHAKREDRLRGERERYKRQARAAEADRDVLCSPTVAKLLTLAVSSDSGGEAVTALEKARALHRKERRSMPDTA